MIVVVKSIFLNKACDNRNENAKDVCPKRNARTTLSSTVGLNLLV